MIKHIRLENYRSIAQLDLELRPITILIGRNGAGKSNFLDFFRLLREGSYRSLEGAVSARGGIGELLFYGARERRIHWELEVNHLLPKEPQASLFYAANLLEEGVGYRLQTEEIFRPPYEGHVEPFKYFSVRNGKILLPAIQAEADEAAYKWLSSELAFTQLAGPQYTMIQALRDEIGDWQLFRGFGHEALREIQRAQAIEPLRRLRLQEDGGNIVSILQELSKGKHRLISEKISEVYQAAFADFERFYPEVVANGRAALRSNSTFFPNREIPAHSWSEGQLRFMLLVIALCLSKLEDAPTLITIDEPEIGLHPAAIELLAELMQSLADSPTQLIIATHSPRLVDLLHPEDVIVVERDEQGATQFERLDMERLHHWLERYSLGRLWTMGRVGW